MLYPTLNDLTKKVGNRYLLVNEVAHRARKIANKAIANNEKLPEKPVKMAILEIAEDLPMNAEELEARAAEEERKAAETEEIGSQESEEAPVEAQSEEKSTEEETHE